MLLVAHELNGNLNKIQPLKLSDVDLCGIHRKYIHFGENLASACQIDLQTLIEWGEQRPWFLNLYLNYTENNLHFIKAVPILIRNAFTYNMVNRIHRFFFWFIYYVNVSHFDFIKLFRIHTIETNGNW